MKLSILQSDKNKNFSRSVCAKAAANQLKIPLDIDPVFIVLKHIIASNLIAAQKYVCRFAV